jgi:CCR4-NOT transcription complex subunit 4
VKLKKEKKQKEKQEKKVGERVVSAVPGVKPSGASLMDRKHLHNYRVVQRNLVYVIGVPASYASEENLRRPEFFGQYGKIGKVVIHRNPASAHTTVSVYVTFVHKEDAKASIQSLDGHWLDQQHILRASFGTTKYCNNFIRGVPCNNPECVYLHDLGDDDDRFTKEEIQVRLPCPLWCQCCPQPFLLSFPPPSPSPSFSLS